MKQTLGQLIAALRKEKGMTQAMGVAVAVLTALNALDARTGLLMLGLGLACLGAAALQDGR